MLGMDQYEMIRTEGNFSNISPSLSRGIYIFEVGLRPRQTAPDGSRWKPRRSYDLPRRALPPDVGALKAGASWYLGSDPLREEGVKDLPPEGRAGKPPHRVQDPRKESGRDNRLFRPLLSGRARGGEIKLRRVWLRGPRPW
jgi:hypothetical protein